MSLVMKGKRSNDDFQCTGSMLYDTFALWAAAVAGPTALISRSMMKSYLINLYIEFISCFACVRSNCFSMASGSTPLLVIDSWACFRALKTSSVPSSAPASTSDDLLANGRTN
uniref:Uncharacterized protein n=1 Tax=Romanomermis culicivorax TaxID=13658 RepID=A0A915IYE4_ROMCU